MNQSDDIIPSLAVHHVPINEPPYHFYRVVDKLLCQLLRKVIRSLSWCPLYDVIMQSHMWIERHRLNVGRALPKRMVRGKLHRVVLVPRHLDVDLVELRRRKAMENLPWENPEFGLQCKVIQQNLTQPKNAV